jgi:hypothetical protein
MVNKLLAMEPPADSLACPVCEPPVIFNTWDALKKHCLLVHEHSLGDLLRILEPTSTVVNEHYVTEDVLQEPELPIANPKSGTPRPFPDNNDTPTPPAPELPVVTAPPSRDADVVLPVLAPRNPRSAEDLDFLGDFFKCPTCNKVPVNVNI